MLNALKGLNFFLICQDALFRDGASRSDDSHRGEIFRACQPGKHIHARRRRSFKCSLYWFKVGIFWIILILLAIRIIPAPKSLNKFDSLCHAEPRWSQQGSRYSKRCKTSKQGASWKVLISMHTGLPHNPREVTFSFLLSGKRHEAPLLYSCVEVLRREGLTT